MTGHSSHPMIAANIRIGKAGRLNMLASKNEHMNPDANEAYPRKSPHGRGVAKR